MEPTCLRGVRRAPVLDVRRRTLRDLRHGHGQETRIKGRKAIRRYGYVLHETESKRGDLDQEPDRGIRQPVQRDVRDLRGRLHRHVRDREIGLPGRGGPLPPALRHHHRRRRKKNIPVDLSHFSIMGTAVGAHGVEADSDKATFEKVDRRDPDRRRQGRSSSAVPFVIPGMGSTNVAKNNWEGLAIGAAISGTILTIGENVAAMDEESEIKNGRVRPITRSETPGRSSTRTGRTTATARSSSRPTSRTRGSASRNTPSRSWASRPSKSSGARAPRTSAARSRSRA